MSLIHIARHGQSLGSFNEEEVKEGIVSKRFVGEDLSWKAGMPEWRPLEEMSAAWGFELTPSQSIEEDATPPPASEPAWERRSEVGFFVALYQTIRAVLFHPGKTFSKLSTTGGLLTPLFYYAMMSMVAFAAVLLYQLPAILKNPTLLSSQLEGISHQKLIAGFAAVWLLSPLFFMIGIFVSSGLTHLSLKIIARTKEPFAATFRTMCYSMGSASIFQLLPFFGGIVSAIWGVIAYSIGLKKVHRISGWRIFCAILLSVALFIIFYLGAFLIASIVMNYLSLHYPSIK